MKSAARLLLIVTLMVSIGGHWGALQVVAWARMIQSYTAQQGIVQGIKDTFDGEHLCPLCKKILANKAQEHQQQKEPAPTPAPAPVEKVEKSPPWLPHFIIAEYAAPMSTDVTSAPGAGAPPALAAQWRSTPPTPPPRLTA